MKIDHSPSPLTRESPLPARNVTVAGGFRRNPFLESLIFLDVVSLIAPLIALAWQSLVARSMQVQLRPLEPLVLMLSIWVLYVADHVFDALRPSFHLWEPKRRTFYKRYWRPMAAFGVCGACATLTLALSRLGRGVIRGGLGVAVFVFVYFLAVHTGPISRRARWPRELGVALVFVLGTFMPVSTAGNHLERSLLPAALIFFLLCWLNCCAIEVREWEEAGRNLHCSPHSSTQWAARNAQYLGIFVGLSSIFFWKNSLMGGGMALAGVGSAAALLVIARLRHSIPINWAGVANDLALCTPLVVLAFRLG